MHLISPVTIVKRNECPLGYAFDVASCDCCESYRVDQSVCSSAAAGKTIPHTRNCTVDRRIRRDTHHKKAFRMKVDHLLLPCLCYALDAYANMTAVHSYSSLDSKAQSQVSP